MSLRHSRGTSLVHSIHLHELPFDTFILRCRRYLFCCLKSTNKYKQWFYSCISGGAYNTTISDVSTISGGQNNTTSNSYSFVGGGLLNTITDTQSSIPGGIRIISPP